VHSGNCNVQSIKPRFFRDCACGQKHGCQLFGSRQQLKQLDALKCQQAFLGSLRMAVLCLSQYELRHSQFKVTTPVAPPILSGFLMRRNNQVTWACL
jgi:hypothetical protein